MDLTEAEYIKIRWKEYTEELYKKDLNDSDKHDGVITHLEPEILESKVKWTLGSITKNKASGGDGIPVEVFQILKYDTVKMLHSICQEICKTQQWPQGWKESTSTPISKKDNAKECSNYQTIALIYFTQVSQFSSVQFSRSVVSDTLQPHESQHERPHCQSPTPGIYPNPCPPSR